MNINVGKLNVENSIIHTQHFTIIVKNLMKEYFHLTHFITQNYSKVHQKIEVDQELKKLMSKIQRK